MPADESKQACSSSRAPGEGQRGQGKAEDLRASTRVSIGVNRGESQKAYRKRFGKHVRSCRKARGFTQERLAEVSGLSADTIRRLEQGSFSPSLDTLQKLAWGFQITLSSLFEAFELNKLNTPRELSDLVMLLSPRERKLFIRLIPFVRALVDGRDGDGE